MEYINLKNGDKVSRIALGTSRLHPNQEGTDTIIKAVECGINQINCADFYGSGDGELAVREALKSLKRDDLFISVKFGALMLASGHGMSGVDVRPEHVENYLAYSLRRLGVEYIDLYQPCRINPFIPIEETMGAIERLKEKGYIRHIGMTQIDAETLCKGNTATQVDLVELNYNLMDRHYEDTTMATARELGIPIATFGVLLAGLIGGTNTQGAKEFLRFISKPDTFENIERNVGRKDQLQAIADRKHCTLAQLAISWVLAQGSDISAIIGSHRPDQAQSSADSLGIRLTTDDLAEIEQLVPKAEARSVYMRDLEMNEKGLFLF